jgi:hypothetical protein
MVRPLYWNGSKEEHLMHAISRSGRALLLGTMLGTLLVVPMLADQKGVVLSADGERRLIDLPASAFGGIPHDPSAQGGSPGGVMPILVSTDWFPAKPIFREPFRPRKAPRHEIETRLEPGDSTAAQIFQPSLSDFYPQALDAFR